jgi:hypothetical protein
MSDVDFAAPNTHAARLVEGAASTREIRRMSAFANHSRHARARRRRPILNLTLASAFSVLALGSNCRPRDPGSSSPSQITPMNISCQTPIQCEPHIPPCTTEFGCSNGSCYFVSKCSEGQQCMNEECCAPNCTGKQCGPDGCGGSCGTCSAPNTCDAAGQCTCVPNCTGKQCGPDGCGGSCGTCSAPNACDASGQCACTPRCTGIRCGESDGCGGQCGCADGKVCCATRSGTRTCRIPQDEGCGVCGCFIGCCQGGVCRSPCP